MLLVPEFSRDRTTLEKTMTVKELIKLLQTYPSDLPVAYSIYSEQCLLEAKDILVAEACEPRPDGWVQRKRGDMPSRPYLMFPGN